MDNLQKLFFTILIGIACPICLLPLLPVLEDGEQDNEDE